MNQGPQYGYNMNADKTWLVMKPEIVEDVRRTFKDAGVKITVDGRRHLMGVLGAEEFARQYVND